MEWVFGFKMLKIAFIAYARLDMNALTHIIQLDIPYPYFYFS